MNQNTDRPDPPPNAISDRCWSYLLGSLDRDEVMRFEQELTTDDGLAQRLMECAVVMSEASATSPADSLKEVTTTEVMANASSASTDASTPRGQRRWLAAAAVAIAASIGWLLFRSPSPQDATELGTSQLAQSWAEQIESTDESWWQEFSGSSISLNEASAKEEFSDEEFTDEWVLVSTDRTFDASDDSSDWISAALLNGSLEGSNLPTLGSTSGESGHEG